MVSGTRLWADEEVYYPVDFEPYTPAHHFEKGEDDPAFRTKLTIALELVDRASTQGIPFRAVVADNLDARGSHLENRTQNPQAGLCACPQAIS